MSYYRVDFLYDTNAYEPDKYCMGGANGVYYRPLIRNTNYVLNIIAVSGPGCLTPDEAFEKAQGNITVKIVSWTNGEIAPITIGDRYLRVDRSVFRNVPKDYIGKIHVSTNHPEGWTAKTPMPSGITILSTNDDVLTFQVGEAGKEFILSITAGNMTKEIVINPIK
jgi:hypothetical protein